MCREESEISIMNGMSLCYAAGYRNTLGAQPGLGLFLIQQEPERQGLSKKLNRNGFPPDSVSQAYQSLALCALELPDPGVPP